MKINKHGIKMNYFLHYFTMKYYKYIFLLFIYDSINL